MNREHTHKCLDCNITWTHVRDTNVPSAVYRERHTCPKCRKHCNLIHSFTDRPEPFPGFFDEKLRLMEVVPDNQWAARLVFEEACAYAIKAKSLRPLQLAREAISMASELQRSAA